MRPQLYCIIGDPVSHSLSPKIQSSLFKKFHINARYEAMRVKPTELANFMRNFSAKYSGANVTIPHKEKIIRFLDGLSPEAKKIGAVNTIVNRKGKLIGYNTDVFGALSALSSRLASRFPRLNSQFSATVLGSGGAARAIVYGLKKAGAQVTILNRTVSRARTLAREFACEYGSLDDFGSAPCDILVNATSRGMKREESQAYRNETPLPQLKKNLKSFKKKPIVMDIVYTPRLTKLLRDARSSGCKIIYGDAMFLAQTAKSFALWTNLPFSRIKKSQILSC